MEGLGLILDSMEYTKFHKGTEHWVQVTRVNSPDDFYVHPIKFLPFIERLESLAPTAKLPSLSINDTVIFNMSRAIVSPKFSRGIITSIKAYKDTVMCDIFALDYGHLCTKIEEEHIWECNGSLAKMPALALRCKLANCEAIQGDRWNNDVIDEFKYCAINERVKMLILDKNLGKLIVELKNSNPYDIATMMAMAGLSVLRFECRCRRRTFPKTASHSDAKEIDMKQLQKKFQTI